ncbi:hypothetical protein MCAV_02160 [[Mycoplasma] cavipharyngis]|uniref:hypothetical protein n=1 Tax=[Mycoplasma] cavipharyngis TaxID=92757 RepID=UPI0037039B55
MWQQIRTNWKNLKNKVIFVFNWNQIDPLIKDQFVQLDAKKQKRYCFLNLFHFIFMLFTWGFILLNILQGIVFPKNGLLNNYSYTIWWKNLGTFTVQSNIFVTLVITAYFIKPNSKLFKNYFIVVLMCAYIAITFLGYNFFIGISIKYATWLNHNNDQQRIDAAASIWNHVFAPIGAIVIALLSAEYFKKFYSFNLKQTALVNFKKQISIGLVYPLSFLIYAAVISLVNVYVVYNGFTNLNANLGYSTINGVGKLIIKSNQQIYNGANDGSFSAIIDNQQTEFVYGRLSNLVFYFLFIGLFALFIFLFQAGINRFCFPIEFNKMKKQIRYYHNHKK